MTEDDLRRLRELLAEMAATYGRRLPTDAALKNWALTLYAFSWLRVEQELRNWMATKPRMPTPGDIYVPLNDAAMAARETAERAAKQQEQKDIANRGQTEVGLKMLDTVKEMLGRRPKSPMLSPALEKMIACVATHYRCSPSELREMRQCAFDHPQDAETCYAALMREISGAQK